MNYNTKAYFKGEPNYVGLPSEVITEGQHVRKNIQAIDNFCRVFAINPGEKVLVLADKLLDYRVIDSVIGLAESRGATVRTFIEKDTRNECIPESIKGLLHEADFVVSTWFCSILDPFCIDMRKKGQRWVKITHFRNYDLLNTPQARFPIDLVGAITKATADLYPKKGDFDLSFQDSRGSDLRINFTEDMRNKQLASNRWRGLVTAVEPGCYVHYLPSHGPNLWDHTSVDNDMNADVNIDGFLYPQWAVGFDKLFEENIGLEFKKGEIVRVTGNGEEAEILREILVGGKLIEGGGCGFNPKAYRHTIYPAGPNAVGTLHFGIDLVKPSDYIRKVMPDWEEPPIHMDLVTFDSTVYAGENMLIDEGFLVSLQSKEVVDLASNYGDPVSLLEVGIG